jgi:DMSO/TMAO reductase YedYZ molybdopterin-dependent catalytic subunit
MAQRRVAARSIRFPWANVALAVFLVLQLVTGLVGLLGDTDPYRVVFWLHAIGAYGIVVLLFAKSMLVLNAVRRRPGVTRARVTLSLMALLLLAVLVTGLVWISAGDAIYVFTSSVDWSLINVHAYLALAFCALIVWHVVDRRWIVRVPAARNRAAFLRIAGVAAAGVVLWQVERTVQRLLDTGGSERRFTGSYERGRSFAGVFPEVSWINDDPQPIDPGSWRLVVDGEVGQKLELTGEQLGALRQRPHVAVLDCTGGWYTEQEWRGPALGDVLALAEPTGRAESVLVSSVTGYARRFSLEKAGELTLATHVADAPLTHGHGYPARLVVPGERGFEWVKWIDRVSVLDSNELLQPPLPLA